MVAESVSDVALEWILARALRDDARIGIDTGTHRLPCVCGHARIKHVDPDGRWFDGLCTEPGCECTPAGYIAFDPLTPLLGDRVIVLRIMLEPMMTRARNVALDSRLGGPTWADLDFGDHRYRVTIVDVDDDPIDPPFQGAS